jgi:hypothetical protein
MLKEYLVAYCNQKYCSHSSFLFMPVILPTGQMSMEKSSNNMQRKEDLELPLFDFSNLACATNNFSIDNKLGEGGFGTVYKVLI